MHAPRRGRRTSGTRHRWRRRTAGAQQSRGQRMQCPGPHGPDAVSAASGPSHIPRATSMTKSPGHQAISARNRPEQRALSGLQQPALSLRIRPVASAFAGELATSIRDGSYLRVDALELLFPEPHAIAGRSVEFGQDLRAIFTQSREPIRQQLITHALQLIVRHTNSLGPQALTMVGGGRTPQSATTDATISRYVVLTHCPRPSADGSHQSVTPSCPTCSERR